jgi:hypothetical protein
MWESWERMTVLHAIKEQFVFFLFGSEEAARACFFFEGAIKRGGD